jgi:DNA-binding transcriptional ArsR family regulator
VEAFAVLADPIRAQIVELLATSERSAGEIAAHFPVSGPAVSRHLRILRESGIATYRVDAQRRVYRLDPVELTRAQQWLDHQLASWRDRFDALGEHLDDVAAPRGRKEHTR